MAAEPSDQEVQQIARGIQLVDPAYYGANGPPHELWTQLRAEAPVEYFKLPEVEGFWAVTRHQDIRFISRQPDKFLSEPGVTLMPEDPNLDETNLTHGALSPTRSAISRLRSPARESRMTLARRLLTALDSCRFNRCNFLRSCGRSLRATTLSIERGSVLVW